MMKKWGLGLMLVAMLATPMLACGFPLPAGTVSTEMGKIICSESEDAATCQQRQDAFQMMSQLNTVSVEEMEMSLIINDGETSQTVYLSGSYDYQVVPAESGLGANIHAYINEGSLVSEDENVSLSGVEFVIVGDKGYTSRDGGATWVEEDLDPDALLGLGLMLGLAGVEGAALDLYSDPAIFSVTSGAQMEMMGQMMDVQTLEVDLMSLLGDAEALNNLLAMGSEVGGDELGAEELGSPDDIAMMAPMLAMFMTGTGFESTYYIGADDGLIHYVEHDYVFTLDMQSIDPESGSITMEYYLSGGLTNFNADLAIVAPEGATPGAGLLSDEGLFGGQSGLGDGLFGE